MNKKKKTSRTHEKNRLINLLLNRRKIKLDPKLAHWARKRWNEYYFTFMTVKWIIIGMPLPADIYTRYILIYNTHSHSIHKQFQIHGWLMYCWSLTKRHREKASIESENVFFLYICIYLVTKKRRKTTWPIRSTSTENDDEVWDERWGRERQRWK